MFEKTFDESRIDRAVLAGLNSPALSRPCTQKTVPTTTISMPCAAAIKLFNVQ